MADLKVWTFIVTVIDEDQYFARERLLAKLDARANDSDYEVATGPGAQELAVLRDKAWAYDQLETMEED